MNCVMIPKEIVKQELADSYYEKAFLKKNIDISKNIYIRREGYLYRRYNSKYGSIEKEQLPYRCKDYYICDVCELVYRIGSMKYHLETSKYHSVE